MAAAAVVVWGLSQNWHAVKPAQREAPTREDLATANYLERLRSTLPFAANVDATPVSAGVVVFLLVVVIIAVGSGAQLRTVDDERAQCFGCRYCCGTGALAAQCRGALLGALVDLPVRGASVFLCD